MGILNSLFTWWNGPGLGTRIATWRHGHEVGRDGDGNIYYRSGKAGGVNERRWVMYNGAPEATRIPPEWHLWMHKTVALPPSEAPLSVRVWERPWSPNATGTMAAYLPSGALETGGTRAAATGDYQAWSPDNSGGN